MFRRATGIITAACCRSHARCLPSTFSLDRFVRHGYPANGNSYVAPDSPKPMAGVGFSHSIRGYCITSGASPERIASANQMEASHKEVKDAINTICLDFIAALRRDYIELFSRKGQFKKALPEHTEILCYLIRPREQPPPLPAVCPIVYVMLRPDKKLYVGETNDWDGRVRSYQSKKGMHNASFFYIIAPKRSMAREIKAHLVKQLPKRGFHLSNLARKHRNDSTTDLDEELDMMMNL